MNGFWRRPMVCVAEQFKKHSITKLEVCNGKTFVFCFPKMELLEAELGIESYGSFTICNAQTNVMKAVHGRIIPQTGYTDSMQKVESDPSEYIKSLPAGVREDIARLDKEISRVMAGQTRVLWQGVFWGGTQQNIIGYGDVVYKRPKKPDVEWFVVGLAVQKNYISLYVSAVQDKQYVTEKYAGKLGKAKVGKSNITFKSLADIDLDALLELIAKAKQVMAQ
jgi:hypothetical protein